MAPAMAAMKKLKIKAKNTDKKDTDKKDAMTVSEFQVHAALQKVRMDLIKNRLRFA